MFSKALDTNIATIVVSPAIMRMEQQVSSVLEKELAVALIPTKSNAVAVMDTTPAIHKKVELSMSARTVVTDLRHASPMAVLKLSQLVLRVAVVIIRAGEVRKVCSIVPF
jgi:hypothetical protein